ncbi:MAG: hypothetical protein DJ555_05775, partial [Desulfurococcaceae archaeon]
TPDHEGPSLASYQARLRPPIIVIIDMGYKGFYRLTILVMLMLYLGIFIDVLNPEKNRAICTHL